jgi:DNA-binding CsgD family transcriptional regulator
MGNFQLIPLDSQIHSSSAKRPVFVNRSSATTDEQPTPRELEVEHLLCQGYSQENIAAIFGRSINTISAHALSLYRKRGVHTQVGLLLAYLERKGIFVFPHEKNEDAETVPYSSMRVPSTARNCASQAG